MIRWHARFYQQCDFVSLVTCHTNGVTPKHARALGFDLRDVFGNQFFVVAVPVGCQGISLLDTAYEGAAVVACRQVIVIEIFASVVPVAK